MRHVRELSRETKTKFVTSHVLFIEEHIQFGSFVKFIREYFNNPSQDKKKKKKEKKREEEEEKRK